MQGPTLALTWDSRCAPLPSSHISRRTPRKKKGHAPSGLNTIGRVARSDISDYVRPLDVPLALLSRPPWTLAPTSLQSTHSHALLGKKQKTERRAPSGLRTLGVARPDFDVHLGLSIRPPAILSRFPCHPSLNNSLKLDNEAHWRALEPPRRPMSRKGKKRVRDKPGPTFETIWGPSACPCPPLASPMHASKKPMPRPGLGH